MRYRRSDYHPDADFEGSSRASSRRARASRSRWCSTVTSRLRRPPGSRAERARSTSSRSTTPAAPSRRSESSPITRGSSARPRGSSPGTPAAVHCRAITISSSTGPACGGAIREALPQRGGRSFAHERSSDLEERIRFRAWFHVTEDEIYLEHGSQYDTLTACRDPMMPVIADGSGLHPVAGQARVQANGRANGLLQPVLRGDVLHGRLRVSTRNEDLSFQIGV